MAMEAVERVVPSTMPQNVLRKAFPGDNPVSRGVTPSKLLSGIFTQAKGQAAEPTRAEVAAVPAMASSWKESGVAAEFCCHWILQ